MEANGRTLLRGGDFTFVGTTVKLELNFCIGIGGPIKVFIGVVAVVDVLLFVLAMVLVEAKGGVAGKGLISLVVAFLTSTSVLLVATAFAVTVCLVVGAGVALEVIVFCNVAFVLFTAVVVEFTLNEHFGL